MHTLLLSLHKCPPATNLKLAEYLLFGYMIQKLPHFSLEKRIGMYAVSETVTPTHREELPLELSTSGRVNLTRGVILSRHHFLLSAYQCIFQRYKRNCAKVLLKGLRMNRRS